MATKQIKISEILEKLDSGKSRKEINEEYGLNPREIKALWSNEKLKNRKPAKYTVDFDLVDDTVIVDYGDKVPAHTNPVTNVIGEGTAPTMSGTF